MKKPLLIFITIFALASVALMAGRTPGGGHHQNRIKGAPAGENSTRLEAGMCAHNEIDSSTETQSSEHSMKSCKDEKAKDCPNCETKKKMMRTGPVSKSHPKVKSVNTHEKTCMPGKMHHTMQGESHNHG